MRDLKGMPAALRLGTAAIAMLAAMPALAQEAVPDEAENTSTEPAPQREASPNDGEIVVTGTRIRGVAAAGSPQLTLDRGAIRASSAVTTDRLLRELPQVFDLGVSENSRGQSGGNSNITYGNSVNLRGIGPYATLLLVDGHRVVGNSRSADPSIIPTLALERVEVVADGSSAIYGSDAVAGVVNLIPRRSLDGIEALARMGVADNFHEEQYGIALGKRWTGGQAMLAYERVYRSNLSGDDRDFFTSDQRRFGGRDYRVQECTPGNIVAGGVSYAIPQGGVTPANAGALVAGTANRCEAAAGQDLFPQTDYHSVAGTFSQDITDWLTVLADGYFSHREFFRNPAYAVGTLTVPNTNAFFVAPPGTNPSSVQVRYNFADDLERDASFGFTETWQVTGGLRVKLPWDWRLNAQVSHGKTRDISDSRNGINNAALNAALASSNPATAFDPFGLGRTSQAVLDAISDQVFYAPTFNKLTVYQANLDGPLFKLGGNDIRFAAGYERQEIVTDLGSQRGAPTSALTFRTFDRQVDSFYGELNVPIFGAANATPGFERLILNAAIRHDRYSDVGSTTNPKFGAIWSPVRGLTFRGSYGTSFRAPIFSQIYGNSNALFVQRYVDPTQGSALVTGLARSGPNLDLGPEEATTWTVGADWEPAPNAKLSLTYFDVLYEGQVAGYLSDLTLLGNEADFAGTGIIFRGEAAAAEVARLTGSGIPILGVPPSPVTLYIDGRNFNLGRSTTKGIDFQAMYRLETAGAGAFTLNANGTYLTEYKLSVTPDGVARDRRNTIFNPLTFRARGSVVWDLDDVSARLQVTHVGGYENILITPVEDVKSFTTFDLGVNFVVGDPQASGFFDNGFTFGIEAVNLFDRKPPYVNLAPSGNGSGGYDATVANPIGRLISVSLRKTW
ncbi:TonB-dependent receptor domain-containing protein [Sphingomonas sp. Y38-1Y]|uniref:TonB-dependent receptor domain-containing protein n=1 Tax=Sphingomonas sp. Y38-1Y TaxID=3078265 RepID=UPI0028ED1AFD|nr:TonB-dependent receptor [Sphingomonas sp. Y38-1Y]